MNAKKAFIALIYGVVRKSSYPGLTFQLRSIRTTTQYHQVFVRLQPVLKDC